MTRLREAGLRVSAPVAGLISDSNAVLVIDSDGVVIELAEVPTDLPDAAFAGIRISAADALATARFLTAIGFVEVEAPRRAHVTDDQMFPGGTGEGAECVVTRFALPEDQHQFTLTVVQHPDTGQHPLPDGGNSQGLYRCALRVENMEKALSCLPDFVERLRGPVWCPLPGTKIEGLYVAFMRSPDGVVFEFVERPLKHFTREL